MCSCARPSLIVLFYTWRKDKLIVSFDTSRFLCSSLVSTLVAATFANFCGCRSSVDWPLFPDTKRPGLKFETESETIEFVDTKMKSETMSQFLLAFRESFWVSTQIGNILVLSKAYLIPPWPKIKQQPNMVQILAKYRVNIILKKYCLKMFIYYPNIIRNLPRYCPNITKLCPNIIWILSN